MIKIKYIRITDKHDNQPNLPDQAKKDIEEVLKMIYKKYGVEVNVDFAYTEIPEKTIKL